MYRQTESNRSLLMPKQANLESYLVTSNTHRRHVARDQHIKYPQKDYQYGQLHPENKIAATVSIVAAIEPIGGLWLPLRELSPARMEVRKVGWTVVQPVVLWEDRQAVKWAAQRVER